MLCLHSEGADAFKEIARLAIHTILAACGFKHLKSSIHSFPSSVCSHTEDIKLRRKSTLMPNSCWECFYVFVKNVVCSIMIEKGHSGPYIKSFIYCNRFKAHRKHLYKVEWLCSNSFHYVFPLLTIYQWSLWLLANIWIWLAMVGLTILEQFHSKPYKYSSSLPSWVNQQR